MTVIAYGSTSAIGVPYLVLLYTIPLSVVGALDRTVAVGFGHVKRSMVARSSLPYWQARINSDGFVTGSIHYHITNFLISTS
jgi:hypothetical protein